MRSRKSGCMACGAKGHIVTQCRTKAAVDYWWRAAGRHREAADEHAVRALQAAEAGAVTDAQYHRRATLLELSDADRAARRAKTVERRIADAAVQA